MTFGSKRECESTARGAVALAAVVVGTFCFDGVAAELVFRDVAIEAGLRPDIEGIRAHAAGWGDTDGDGWLDLYVATFHTKGTGPNLFFRGQAGRFHLDGQESLRLSTRASGALLVDLDNDGDLDLYVSSMPGKDGSELARKEGHAIAGCSLLRNDGNARFTNVSAGNGACPTAFGGRSATVLDYDGDGLLDLLVGEDPLPGYNGSPTKSSRLFRNLGELRFEDVSRQAGLPEGIPGFGVAAADVNDDGWPDIFLAAPREGNRLFLNDRQGKFGEAPGSRETFAWPTAGGDNMVCGVCFGDVNRDGLPDVVLGHHFERPWMEPVANRLYLHRGTKDGVPRFEDVTEAAGLIRLPMKAPHVEIQDFDNDGRVDIATSIVKFADGKPYLVIFRGLGVRDGLPRFAERALEVNDFPTAEDRAIQKTGAFFDKLLLEKKILYTAPGPSGDFDNDGRLDLFLASWWPEAPSLLLHNETVGGHWLDVKVEGASGVNRMGIGAKVRIYASGKLGDSVALVGYREIAVGYGYASGQSAEAHFGLGDIERVDIEVALPHGRGKLVRRDVTVNQKLVIRP